MLDPVSGAHMKLEFRHELRVDAPSGDVDDAWVAKLSSDFHNAHEREYTRRFDDVDIELPNVRVRGIGQMPELSVPEVETRTFAGLRSR